MTPEEFTRNEINQGLGTNGTINAMRPVHWYKMMEEYSKDLIQICQDRGELIDKAIKLQYKNVEELKELKAYVHYVDNCLNLNLIPLDFEGFKNL